MRCYFHRIETDPTLRVCLVLELPNTAQLFLLQSTPPRNGLTSRDRGLSRRASRGISGWFMHARRTFTRLSDGRSRGEAGTAAVVRHIPARRMAGSHARGPYSAASLTIRLAAH